MNISETALPSHGVKSIMRSFQRFPSGAARVSRNARLRLSSTSISIRNSVSGRPALGVPNTAIENWSTAFGGTFSGDTHRDPSNAVRDFPSNSTSLEG